MISIIVPVLNEEKNIGDTIQNVSILKGDFEVIVVDGGSSDKTMEIAEKSSIAISSEKGRATQMNAGARRAKGDVLLFLHADSRLSPDALMEIEKSLDNKKVVGGALKFHLDGGTPSSRFISLFANLRADIFKIFPGDHGQFVRKSAFDKIGGFSEIELMEDIDFCKRLRRVGKLVQLSSKITSSSRSFKRQGVFKTFLYMQMIRFLFFIGIPPLRLWEIYFDKIMDS